MKEFITNEQNLNINEFLVVENSSRFFNLDESGLPLQGTNGKLKVKAEKMIKNVHMLAPDTKEKITV